MALGDYNNNKNNYSPSLYSQYKLSNLNEGAIDKTTLAPSYWNSMLKLTIAPLSANSNENNISFDYDNGISCYLSHTKARTLLHEIEKFEENNKIGDFGVATGAGLVSINDGKEFGKNTPCLVIRKINQEGAIEATFIYEFKSQYHYSVRNFNSNTSKFDKIFYDDLEIEQFKDLLNSYYVAMTGAVAYSIIDAQKYDNSRINTKINSMCEKLGIDFKNGKKSSGNSNSYFNGNNSNKTQNSISYEDIENQLG